MQCILCHKTVDIFHSEQLGNITGEVSKFILPPDRFESDIVLPGQRFHIVSSHTEVWYTLLPVFVDLELAACL